MKRIIIIALFLVSGASIAYAQGLDTLSNNVTRHAPSTASDHQIRFKTTAGLLEASDTLTITFEGSFDLSALTVSDIDLLYGPSTGVENSLSLQASATSTDWGVSIATSTLTFEHPTDNNAGDIPSNSFIVVNIGSNAGGSNQIINPASEGTEIIRISTSTGESGALAVPIAQDQVGTGATVSNDPTVTIQWAVPELRVGSPETNDDAQFYISLLSSSEVDDTIEFTQPSLVTLATDGTYATPIQLTSQSTGTYDVIIKTHQHLSKKLNDISLGSGNTVLNFTTLDNSGTKGGEVLLAGDINGAGTSPSTLGDNVVNSVDVSTLLVDLDEDDATGNVYRANVNQDTVVNSVDLSILIKNLDSEGEK